MATNPYPKLADTLQVVREAGMPDAVTEKAVAAITKVSRPGRPAPEATTAKLRMAQNHTKRAYGERNDLMAVVARTILQVGGPEAAHLMKLTDNLEKLSNNVTVCLHPPGVEPVWWVISKDEAKKTFPFLGDPDHAIESHYQKMTREQRTERLAAISFADLPAQLADAPIAPAPAPPIAPAPTPALPPIARYRIAEWRRTPKRRTIGQRKK